MMDKFTNFIIDIVLFSVTTYIVKFVIIHMLVFTTVLYK